MINGDSGSGCVFLDDSTQQVGTEERTSCGGVRNREETWNIFTSYPSNLGFTLTEPEMPAELQSKAIYNYDLTRI